MKINHNDIIVEIHNAAKIHKILAIVMDNVEQKKAERKAYGPRHPNLFRPYTAAEDARLMELRKSGMRYVQIAKEMGRTPTALSQRTTYLNRRAAAASA